MTPAVLFAWDVFRLGAEVVAVVATPIVLFAVIAEVRHWRREQHRYRDLYSLHRERAQWVTKPLAQYTYGAVVRRRGDAA